MPVARHQVPPPPEVVTWDGTNDTEVVDLITRVQGLHVWGPLEHGDITFYIEDDELHVVAGEDGGTDRWPVPAPVVARVAVGNTLVFDLFRETPLFVVNPDELAAFYDLGD